MFTFYWTQFAQGVLVRRFLYTMLIYGFARALAKYGQFPPNDHRRYVQYHFKINANRKSLAH
jgi:hypothetical protein